MSRSWDLERSFQIISFNMKYSEKQGWHDAVIEGYRDLCLDPAAVCLHYGQLIFEGMKAYRGKDGSIYLFRPGG